MSFYDQSSSILCFPSSVIYLVHLVEVTVYSIHSFKHLRVLDFMTRGAI